MISTLRSRLIRVVGMICDVSAIGADTAVGASVPSRPATAAVPDFGAIDAYVEAQRVGARAIWHGGDMFAFQSFMVLQPDTGRGVVLLSNEAIIAATGAFEEVTWNLLRMLDRRALTNTHANDSAWAHGLLAGGLALQLLGMLRGMRNVSRWRREPRLRPARWPIIAARCVLPSAVNLVWGSAVFIGVPLAFAPLRVPTFIPDIGIALLLSGAVALLWGVVRAVLMLRVMRPAL